MLLARACVFLVLALAGAADSGARLDELRVLPPPALAERLRATSPEELIGLGREGVRRLGTYRARLLKQERVGGKLLPAQTMEVVVQPSPRAQRLEYVEGPKSGRKVIWTQKRPSEMLVREAGILGIASLWIDLNGGLAHGDTNHSVTELGFAPLLDLVASDLHKGQAFGGLVRKDQGFDGSGAYCMEYTAPPGAKGLYAQRTRLCVDAKLGLPVKIEVYDGQGFLERYEYTNVRPNQKVDPALFEDL
ncbi:MAG TPA: DUF1571 domain-containing protein [Polyangia bacterium]|jgi:hypothetical protein